MSIGVCGVELSTGVVMVVIGAHIMPQFMRKREVPYGTPVIYKSECEERVSGVQCFQLITESAIGGIIDK